MLISGSVASGTVTYTTTDSYSRLLVIVSDGQVGAISTSFYPLVSTSSGTVNYIYQKGQARTNDGISHGTFLTIAKVKNVSMGATITITSQTPPYATLIYTILA